MLVTRNGHHPKFAAAQARASLEPFLPNPQRYRNAALHIAEADARTSKFRISRKNTLELALFNGQY
jgi:hypothetical protein